MLETKFLWDSRHSNIRRLLKSFYIIYASVKINRYILL